ncbi:LTA synthase family protein [Mycoplasmatota bacterium]|nr:LTA synthase family protein [Mycoplasmatota bacterium]
MKQISKTINKFITFIMFVVESCVSAIGEDLLLLGFLIAAFIPNVIIKATSDMSIFNLRSLLFNFAWYCLVVALSYNYKKKKTRIVYFSIVTFIVYVLNYSNIMYYRYYDTFLSLSLIKQLTLFSDVADATQVGMSFFDILYWVLLTLSIALIITLTVFKYNNFDYENSKIRVFNRLNFIRLALIAFITGIITLAPANYSQAQKLWNRPIVVQDFGLYNYHVIDIYKSIGVFIEHKPNESEYKEFLDYFEEKNSTDKTNQYTDILKGKNIIIIHAESIENFVVNQKVQDVDGNEIEITPNLNKLANEGLYFSNFYTQQSIGTSADSEFVFNSSLLPVNNGTVFLTHFDRTYTTTQNLLQKEGYLTMYMHGNNGSFWNRDIMHKVMGYDVFFSKNEYHFNENQTIGLGISDYDFFNQSADIIANATTPYLATLITLTNHTPWNDVDKYITKDELGVEEPAIDCGAIGLEDTTVCRYLKAVRYTDWSLGQFIKLLEERGLLEDTSIVLYGDHPAKLPSNEMELYYQEDLTRVQYKSTAHVPFIIWNEEIKPREIKTIMGEYDVGPTLQNMLGIKNEFALGHDMFSIENNIVPFVNGDWTDGIIYYSFRDHDYYIMNPHYTQEMIDQMIDNNDYINLQSEKVNRIIDMSNMINKYDLIAYYEAKSKEDLTGN